MKMKRFFLTIITVSAILASCSGEEGAPSLHENLNDVNDVEAAVQTFGEGRATTAQEYFAGVLAELIDVDVKFDEVTRLDAANAPEEDFVEILDEATVIIKDAREAMKLYDRKNWPKRKELQTLTLEWFDSMEGLIDNYLYDLVEPMSKPDKEWSKEDFDFYDEYRIALEKHFNVDAKWVDFQNEFAEANGFVFSEEVDQDALVDDDLEKHSGS